MSDNSEKQGHTNYNLTKTRPTVARKTFIVSMLVALLAIVILWVWSSIKLDAAKSDAHEKRESLKQQSTAMLVQTHEQYLKLLAKPFVWAVRSEMLQGNNGQVNLYINDMVKEKNFLLIAVIDSKNVIVSSTNKKNEGKPFSIVGNISDLNVNTTSVKNLNDSLLTVASPVMGFNNRIATIYMQYKIPATKFVD